MLKHLFVVISVSLLAVACGGGAEGAKSADDAAKTDAPAADAPKADAPAADAPKADAPAGDAKPAGEAAPK